MINPLTVAHNGAKKRLVLDLRTVNYFIKKDKIKFEDISFASKLFKKDQFFLCFDLSSGYHHVDIYPSHQTFLGFSWNFAGNPRFFKYCALPFGLASAGYIFTKILKTLLRVWRSKGIKVALYLDDGLIINDSYEKALENARIVQQDLSNAGFVLNDKKSCWTPTKQINWLGFILNSESNVFEIQERKFLKIEQTISTILTEKHNMSAIDLSKFVGQIIALFHAYGSLVYLQTKACQLWISLQPSWSRRNALEDEQLAEIYFWKENLRKIKYMSLEKPKPSFTRVIYTDASGKGCGGFIAGMANTEVVQKWTPFERSLSSTWRELKAILIFLSVHLVLLKDQSVLLYTDNQAVVSIARKGSMTKDLHELAKELYSTCATGCISLKIVWIPRSMNDIADHLSKICDIDDWSISEHIFNFIQNKIGCKFTLDAFASTFNAKCPIFYSKYWCLSTSGVDAFAFNWQNEICWVVPPISLLAQAIAHAQICRAKGVIIFPKWKSSLFWPMIYQGNKLNKGFSLLLEYHNPKEFFVRGHDCNDVFSEKPFRSSVCVMSFDFSYWL